jgi:conjugal transfer/entry exclusion protein
VAVGTALAFLVPVVPAYAQWAVYDGANHVQNVLIAARTLQQIDNQITSLANQAQMLVNQAAIWRACRFRHCRRCNRRFPRPRHCSRRRRTSPTASSRSSSSISRHTSVSSGMSDSALFSQAQTRWQNSVGGFEDALKLQARVVGNIPSDSSAMTQLVSASQTSTGALQAAQAGNQLMALQSRQLSDIQAELAANGRATALQQAREAARKRRVTPNISIFRSMTPMCPARCPCSAAELSHGDQRCRRYR